VRSELVKIRQLRAENNDFWMEIVEVALKYAPPEVVNPLLIEISKRDAKINLLWDGLRK
jgi:hypothetical protein